MSDNGKPKCLLPGCKSEYPRIIRGMCSFHYNSANEAVVSGQTTWEELERLGLAAPSKKAKGGVFMAALEAARAKKVSE